MTTMDAAESQPQPLTAASSFTTATQAGATIPAMPASFLQGRLLSLSADSVQELHAKFAARMAALVDQALPGCDDAALKAAAHDYCIAASRTRAKLTAKSLAEEAAQGTAHLQQSAAQMLSGHAELEQNITRRQRETARVLQSMAQKASGFSLKQFAQNMVDMLTPGRKNAAAPAEAPAFDANDRVYFRLDDASTSPVQPLVEEYCAQRGYTVTDYTAGRALDGRKNEWKIGKILKDNDGLLQAYFNDPARASKNLMVVITKDVGDIARGSFNRGWESCRADAASAVRYAVDEVQAGVMSAYLVSADDPDIHNPLARINIKPYDKIVDRGDSYRPAVDKRDTIYAAFNPIGLHHPGFVDAVNRYVEETYNLGKTGRYALRDGCERYQEFERRTRLPQDAQEALEMLGVKYAVEDGVVTVKGNIDMSNLGLARLPDLTKVRCLGRIDVSSNRLLTLEGLPQGSVMELEARKNLLVCFAGAPARVLGCFDYRDNPWLMTTHGAPQAKTYKYGNVKGYGSEKNHSQGDVCIGPVEEPQKFPGFKR